MVKHLWAYCILLLSVGFSHVARADAADECAQNCVAVGDWQFNIGLGLGWRSNPLHQGDEAPMLVLPEVSYYGKRFFLKNLELGWTLFEDSRHQWNVLLTPGNDQMFFNRWDPFNFVDSNHVSASGYTSSTFSLSIRADARTAAVDGLVPPAIDISSGGNTTSSSAIPPVQPVATLELSQVTYLEINGEVVSLSATSTVKGADGNVIYVNVDSKNIAIDGVVERDVIAILTQSDASGKAQVNSPTSSLISLVDGELVVVPSESGGEPESLADNSGSQKKAVAAADVQHRKVAGLLGIEYMYSADWLDLHLQLLNDVTGVHGGHEARAAVIVPWQLARSRWAFTLGAVYKSRGVLDYYYGLSAADGVAQSEYFNVASAGIATMVRIDWQRPISRRWSLRAMAQFTELPKEIHASPLLSRRSVNAVFFGGVYHF